MPPLSHIDNNTQDHISRLIDYANINSHSHNYPGLSQMLERLIEDFSSLPGKLSTIPLDNNPKSPKALQIITRPSASIQIFFCGHYDTVYPIDHPFQSCNQPDVNTLHGPGVTDMKGGLVIMLAALQAFETSPHKDQIGYQVLITPDEEISSPLSSTYFKKIAESKQYQFALSFEPSFPDGSLARSRMGVSTFTITAHGKAAHAGRNLNQGKNAINLLTSILSQLHNVEKQFPQALFNVGHIQGGGPVNVVPDLASAKINIRTPVTQDAANIPKAINTLINQYKEPDLYAELSGSFTKFPKPITPTTEFLFQSLQSCANELDFPLEWHDTGGASDGNTLAHHGLHNIDNLGITGNHIHSDQEFAHLPSLPQRAKLTTLFLLKLASHEISIPQT